MSLMEKVLEQTTHRVRYELDMAMLEHFIGDVVIYVDKDKIEHHVIVTVDKNEDIVLINSQIKRKKAKIALKQGNVFIEVPQGELHNGK